MKDLVIIVGIVGGIIIVVSGLVFGLDYASIKSACDTWKIQTDRQVKFVSNFPFYFDCLIKTSSGWISGTHLYQNETPNIKK